MPISVKEIKLVQEIVNILNKEFPPEPISTQLLINGSLVHTKVIPRKYFSAYKDSDKWWLMVADYNTWQGTQEYLKDMCFLMKDSGFRMISCLIHPVQMNEYNRQALAKKIIYIK